MKNIYIAIILIIAGCSKENNVTPAEDKTGTVTFYMSPTTHNWNLLVDGSDRGSLHGSVNMPVCNDPSYITLTLSVGSHSIDAKSMDGLAWGASVNYNVAEGCHTYKVR